MIRPHQTGRAVAAWRLLLVLAIICAGARASADENPNGPIVSFLGVGADLSVGDARSHEIERSFSAALEKCTGIVIQLPPTLDENLGVETREGLRDSEVLEAHLKEYARVLGDFVVTIRVTRKPAPVGNGDEAEEHRGPATEEERPLISHIRVLKISSQHEVFSVSIPSRDSVAVKNVVARIQELGVPDEAPNAPEQAPAATEQHPATAGQRPPPVEHEASPESSAPHHDTPPGEQGAPEQASVSTGEIEHHDTPEHKAPVPVHHDTPPTVHHDTPPPERHETPPPATLEHSPVETVQATTPIMIRASARATGKFTVTAFFRHGATDAWTPVELAVRNDGKFVGALPPQAQGGVDYYVSLTDGAQHELAHSGTSADPHHVEITPPPRPRVWRHDLGWALAAIGVATLGAGIGVGVSFQQAQTRFRQTYEPGSAVASQLRSINTQAIGADILLPVGGVLAVTGGTLVIVF